MQSLRNLVGRWAPATATQRVGPIGLDIGRSAARLLQFSTRSDGSLEVAGSAELKFKEDEQRLPTLFRSLGQIVRSNGLRGRGLTVAMPAGDYRLIPISYRPAPDQSSEAAIAGQMADRLDGDLSEYVIDAVPVRSAARDSEQQALVAVSRRDRVERLLDGLSECGLVPDVVEIAPVALRRLVSRLPGSQDGLTLIVNTGLERSYLTLLHGRRLLIDQAIEFGEAPLLERLAQTLSLTVPHARSMVLRTGLRHGHVGHPQDHREGETGVFNTLLEILRPNLTQLVDHTDRVFMYAAAQTRGGGAARMLLFGALARWPGCADVIGDMTHLPVAVPTMTDIATRGDQYEHDGTVLPMPDYAVAAGLALRGLVDDA